MIEVNWSLTKQQLSAVSSLIHTHGNPDYPLPQPVTFSPPSLL